MELYNILERLNISYNEVEHKKVCTIDEASFIKNMIEGIGCKNLFLKDKNGNFILVVLEDSKKAKMKEIAKVLGTSHLSFADEEELKNILGLDVGSVTPLGIINDVTNKVILVIDKDLVNKKLLMHPNINTKTISIDYSGLIKFVEYFNHKYYLI